MFIIINGPTIFMPIHLASRILSLTHVHMSYIWFQLNNWSLPAANHLTFIHKDSNHKMQSKFDLRLYHIFLSGVKPLDANCKMLISYQVSMQYLMFSGNLLKFIHNVGNHKRQTKLNHFFDSWVMLLDLQQKYKLCLPHFGEISCFCLSVNPQ